MIQDDDKINNTIVSSLFRTNAIEVCEAGKPFFYTSGKFGPYYINTHYLFGSKRDAEDLLSVMDNETQDKMALPLKLKSLIMKQYSQNDIFRSVIDLLADEAVKFHPDHISGGERRDFFFSIPVAVRLNLPHISIFKDGSVFLSTDDFNNTIYGNGSFLSGSKVLHIADLVTEASSYTRAWIPAIRNSGTAIDSSLSVVDRNQGGAEVMASEGIRFKALAVITDDFFENAMRSGYISDEQFCMIRSFTADPDRFIVDFLASDPGFLERQIALGGKAKERALRCIEQGYDKRVN